MEAAHCGGRIPVLDFHRTEARQGWCAMCWLHLLVHLYFSSTKDSTGSSAPEVCLGMSRKSFSILIYSRELPCSSTHHADLDDCIF